MHNQTIMKRVLNAGCGAPTNQRLHVSFSRDGWHEVRLDIDARVAPDLIGAIQDMRSIVPDASFDAVWSSHNIEHLHSHEVPAALKEMRRILRPDGFAFVTCPDLEAICRLVLERGLGAEAYMSRAGPITASDMLFGHGRAIAAGNTFMCHNTGFDAEALGAAALAAGFVEARIAPGRCFDLWAILTMQETDLPAIKQLLAGTGEEFLVSE